MNADNELRIAELENKVKVLEYKLELLTVTFELYKSDNRSALSAARMHIPIR